MNTQGELIIFSAKTTTATGAEQLLENFRHVSLTLASSGNANFTVKFQISDSTTKPDFSAARTVSNRWEYVQVKDLQNNATIDGDVGVAFAGTDDVRMFEVNTNGQKWVCATITAISAGAVSLFAKPFSN